MLSKKSLVSYWRPTLQTCTFSVECIKLWFSHFKRLFTSILSCNMHLAAPAHTIAGDFILCITSTHQHEQQLLQSKNEN